MPRKLKPRRPQQRRTRVFMLDGDVYLVTDRDDESLYAVRLDDNDRDTALSMLNDADVEIESHVLGGGR